MMFNMARGIWDQLDVVASSCIFCCAGLSWLDIRYVGASVSITGSMPGLLFRVWHMYVLGAAKRLLLFIGLVNVVTSGGSAIL